MHSLASIILVGDSIGMCFVFAVIAGVIALVIWSVNHQKKIREAWLQFARNHNLQVQGATNRPTIQGWFGPTWIGLNTVVRGSGKNRSTYTQHHATVNAPMPQGLVLYKEGFFSKVGKALGGQDVQTGDRQLDDAFIIKGQDLLGIHDLLNMPQVKQALLYVVARHPGIRIDQRKILVEHSGMTGDLTKLDAMFSDLSYLVQTFDAAYQELLDRQGGGKKASKPAVKAAPKSNRQTPVSSSAAAAEILGSEFFDKQARRGATKTRQAAPDEDPATRAGAMSQMADVLHQYEQKLEKGEVSPDVLHEVARSDSMDNAASNAFADQDVSDVFAASNTGGRDALDAYNPMDAWDSKAIERDTGKSAFDEPDAGNAFDDPVPIETTPVQTPTEPAPVAGGSFDSILAQLLDSSKMSGDREKLIEANRSTSFEVELVVERVDSTWGFDTPDNLRDGKTVEAHVKGGDTKVSMRFPKERNDQIGKLRSGEDLKARGVIAAWDDLFKKATLNAR
ncbi:MAG: hypothetical protein K8I27_07250 [Planctomycetes bacterium]|nr:hypothetical protein [Planctomycetota bacterium]